MKTMVLKNNKKMIHLMAMTSAWKFKLFLILTFTNTSSQ